MVIQNATDRAFDGTPTVWLRPDPNARSRTHQGQRPRAHNGVPLVAGLGPGSSQQRAGEDDDNEQAGSDQPHAQVVAETMTDALPPAADKACNEAANRDKTQLL